jgi:hypothetical protein
VGARATLTAERAARALGVDVSNFAVKGEGLIYHQDA